MFISSDWIIVLGAKICIVHLYRQFIGGACRSITILERLITCSSRFGIVSSIVGHVELVASRALSVAGSNGDSGIKTRGHYSRKGLTRRGGQGALHSSIQATGQSVSSSSVENPVYVKHAAEYRDYRQRCGDILYAQELCQFSNAIFAHCSPPTDRGGIMGPSSSTGARG